MKLVVRDTIKARRYAIPAESFAVRLNPDRHSHPGLHSVSVDALVGIAEPRSRSPITVHGAGLCYTRSA